MAEKEYVVYYHQNMINGKYYFGLTSLNPPSLRWQRGNGYKSNRYFYAAIKKYGWDNFIHAIVAYRLTKKQAQRLEIACIRDYETTNPKWGYNISTGGDGCSGWHPTEEQRKAISERMKKFLADPEKKAKWVQAHLGKRLSEEAKHHLSESRIGAKNPVAKSVICLTTGQVFDTVKEAAEFYGLKSPSGIGRAITHTQGRKTAGKLKDGTSLEWAWYNGVNGNR